MLSMYPNFWVFMSPSTQITFENEGWNKKNGKYHNGRNTSEDRKGTTSTGYRHHPPEASLPAALLGLEVTSRSGITCRPRHFHPSEEEETEGVRACPKGTRSLLH